MTRFASRIASIIILALTASLGGLAWAPTAMGQGAPAVGEPPPPVAAPRGQVIQDGAGELKTGEVGPDESQAAPKIAPKAAVKGKDRANKRIRVLPLSEKTIPNEQSRKPAAQVLAVPVNKTLPLPLPRAVRDVVIGNPEIADVIVRAADQIYIAGKTVGDTNVFLIDADNKVLKRIEISVRLDVESLKDALAQHLPDEAIEANGVGDSIVLSGQARSDGAAAQARNLARRHVKGDDNVVNMIKIRTEQQVMLQVKVAEIQKTALKELGLKHSGLTFNTGSLTLNQLGTTKSAAADFAAVLTLSNIIDNLSTTLSLLETQGLVRNLAEPNLVAVSGESANLLAGGEYPIPIPDESGIKIEYKPFGVGLTFLPVVLDNGRISLKLETEVSALGATTVTYGNNTVPSFTVRRASSTIELPSGGSFMIAGLLQNDVTAGLGGVPGVMDLPIIGALFKSTSFKRNESELVVLVSAYLVKPSDPRNLVAPTDGFVVSHDLSRYLLGRLQDIYVRKPAQKALPAGGPQGPIGHIID